MSKISILYFSGYGHAVKLAQAVAHGAAVVSDAQVHVCRISDQGDISEDDWSELAGADAIIFGSPTYMGGPAWQFNKIADARAG